MSQNTIYSKLASVKSEVGKMSKDSTNPFFKSKYFDINQLLEHLEPLCQKNGLLILQPIQDENVITQIIEIETGEMVYSSIKLPSILDPQKIGSAITYYRRYSLQSLLGIQAEDDDASKASKPKAPQKIEKVLISDEKLKKEINTFDNVDQFIDFRTKYALTNEQKPIVTDKFNTLFPQYKK